MQANVQTARACADWGVPLVGSMSAAARSGFVLASWAPITEMPSTAQVTKAAHPMAVGVFGLKKPLIPSFCS